jgi:hypothetical protein
LQKASAQCDLEEVYGTPKSPDTQHNGDAGLEEAAVDVVLRGLLVDVFGRIRPLYFLVELAQQGI